MPRNSSSTTNTEAEERLPTFRNDSHEASRAPSFNCRASETASSTRGPPVWIIQLAMSSRRRPWSSRKESTSAPRFSRITLGTSGQRQCGSHLQICSNPSRPVYSDRRWSGSRLFPGPETRFTARHQHGCGSIAEQSRCNQVGNGDIVALPCKRAQFNSQHHCHLLRKPRT